MVSDWAQLPWVIVGAGRSGQLIGLLGRAHGHHLEAIWNRTLQSSQRAMTILGEVPSPVVARMADLAPVLAQPAVVWVTLVDDVLVEVVEDVVKMIHEDSLVFHTAGSIASSIFKEAGLNALCGSLHPLQAIADPLAALQVTHTCTWTVEGDDVAVDFAMRLMAKQGVVPLRVQPQTKALYHASAVTVANLLVSLVDAAFEMAAAAGIEPQQAQREMLLPLAQSCLDNLQVMPPARALTGPVARGDEATIERHMRALSHREDLLEIYQVLTRRAKQLMQDSQPIDPQFVESKEASS